MLIRLHRNETHVNSQLTECFNTHSRWRCHSLISHTWLKIVLPRFTDMHWPDNFTSNVGNRDTPSRWLLAFVASFLWTKRSVFSAYEHGGSVKVNLDWMLLTLRPRTPPQSMLYISNRSTVILNVLHKLIRTWIQCWYEVGRFCLLLFFSLLKSFYLYGCEIKQSRWCTALILGASQKHDIYHFGTAAI